MVDLAIAWEQLCEEVKLWLRITGGAADMEIEQTIQSALLDLKVAGVVKADPSDALIKQAVKLYCKAQFGYDAESAKYETAYEHLKTALALCGEYNTTK